MQSRVYETKYIISTLGTLFAYEKKKYILSATSRNFNETTFCTVGTTGARIF